MSHIIDLGNNTLSVAKIETVQTILVNVIISTTSVDVAGALRFNSGNLQLYDGSGWQTLQSSTSDIFWAEPSTGTVQIKSNKKLDLTNNLYVNNVVEHSSGGVTVNNLVLSDSSASNTGGLRYHSGSIDFYNGTSWVSLLNGDLYWNEPSSGTIQIRNTKKLDLTNDLMVGNILEHAAGYGITMTGLILADTTETNTGTLRVHSGVLQLYDGSAWQSYLTSDQYWNEPTSNLVTIKGNKIAVLTNGLYVNAIGEYSAGVGVTLISPIVTDSAETNVGTIRLHLGALQYYYGSAWNTALIADQYWNEPLTNTIQVLNNKKVDFPNYIYVSTIKQHQTGVSVTVENLVVSDSTNALPGALRYHASGIQYYDASTWQSLLIADQYWNTSESNIQIMNTKKVDLTNGLLVDSLSEHTTAAGVTINNLIVSDSVEVNTGTLRYHTGSLQIYNGSSWDTTLFADQYWSLAAGILQNKDNTLIDLTDDLQVDLIKPHTLASGVTINHLVLTASTNTVAGTISYSSGIIQYYDGADWLTLGTTASFWNEPTLNVVQIMDTKKVDLTNDLMVDNIKEHTTAAGVTITGLIAGYTENTTAGTVRYNSGALEYRDTDSWNILSTAGIEYWNEPTLNIVQIKDTKKVDLTNDLTVDNIKEHSTAAGVTVTNLVVSDSTGAIAGEVRYHSGALEFHDASTWQTLLFSDPFWQLSAGMIQNKIADTVYTANGLKTATITADSNLLNIVGTTGVTTTVGINATHCGILTYVYDASISANNTFTIGITTPSGTSSATFSDNGLQMNSTLALKALYMSAIDIYVDANYAGTIQNGTILNPFTTLTAAIAAIPLGVIETSPWNDMYRIINVYVAGGFYNEAIIIPTTISTRVIHFIAHGFVYIGSHPSTPYFEVGSTTRNLEWRLSRASTTTLPCHPTLSLLTDTSDTSVSGHSYYGKSGWFISGDVLIGDVSASGNTSITEFHFQNTIVYGTFAMTSDSHNMDNTNIYLSQCHFLGAILLPYTGSTYTIISNLVKVENCRFDAIVTCSTIAVITDSAFEYLLTINTIASLVSILAPYIRNTLFYEGITASTLNQTTYVDDFTMQRIEPLLLTNVTFDIYNYGLTTQGSLLTSSGSALKVKTLGTSGKILTADTTDVSGLTWTSNIKADSITEYTTSAGISLTGSLKADTIIGKTSANTGSLYGITITNSVIPANAIAQMSHSGLSGLSSDDHTQYALLTGRAGNTLVIDTINGLTAGTSGSIFGVTVTLGKIASTSIDGTFAHSGLSGLSSDDHTQYALLAGRSGDTFKVNTIAGVTTANTGSIFGITVTTGTIPSTAISGSFAHSGLSGLSSDDHSQYALLAGRTGDTLKIDTLAGSANTYIKMPAIVCGGTVAPTWESGVFGSDAAAKVVVGRVSQYVACVGALTGALDSWVALYINNDGNGVGNDVYIGTTTTSTYMSNIHPVGTSDLSLIGASTKNIVLTTTGTGGRVAITSADTTDMMTVYNTGAASGLAQIKVGNSANYYCSMGYDNTNLTGFIGACYNSTFREAIIFGTNYYQALIPFHCDTIQSATGNMSITALSTGTLTIGSTGTGGITKITTDGDYVCQFFTTNTGSTKKAETKWGTAVTDNAYLFYLNDGTHDPSGNIGVTLSNTAYPALSFNSTKITAALPIYVDTISGVTSATSGSLYGITITTSKIPSTAISGSFAHSGLSGLTSDDHTQYALLAGRRNDTLNIGYIGEAYVSDGVEIDSTVETIINRTTSGIALSVNASSTNTKMHVGKTDSDGLLIDSAFNVSSNYYSDIDFVYTNAVTRCITISSNMTTMDTCLTLGAYSTQNSYGVEGSLLFDFTSHVPMYRNNSGWTTFGGALTQADETTLVGLSVALGSLYWDTTSTCPVVSNTSPPNTLAKWSKFITSPLSVPNALTVSGTSIDMTLPLNVDTIAGKTSANTGSLFGITVTNSMVPYANVSAEVSSPGVLGLVTMTDASTGVAWILTLGASTCYIRAADVDGTPLLKFAVSSASLTLTPGTTGTQYYVYIQYNSGTPNYTTAASLLTDTNTNIVIGRVYCVPSSQTPEIYINNYYCKDIANYIENTLHRNLVAGTFSYISGGAVSTTSVLVSTTYYGEYAFTQYTGSMGSNVAIMTAKALTDNFRYLYRDASSVWIEQSLSPYLANGVYQSSSGGTVTEATANNRWYNTYVFALANNLFYAIYGTARFTSLALAQAETVPVLPIRIANTGALLARITVVGVNTAAPTITVQSLLPSNSYTSATTTLHSALSGLSSDDHLQYALLAGRTSDTLKMNTINTTAADTNMVFNTTGTGKYTFNIANVTSSADFEVYNAQITAYHLFKYGLNSTNCLTFSYNYSGTPTAAIGYGNAYNAMEMTASTGLRLLVNTYVDTIIERTVGGGITMNSTSATSSLGVYNSALTTGGYTSIRTGQGVDYTLELRYDYLEKGYIGLNTPEGGGFVTALSFTEIGLVTFPYQVTITSMTSDTSTLAISSSNTTSLVDVFNSALTTSQYATLRVGKSSAYYCGVRYNYTGGVGEIGLNYNASFVTGMSFGTTYITAGLPMLLAGYNSGLTTEGLLTYDFATHHALAYRDNAGWKYITGTAMLSLMKIKEQGFDNTFDYHEDKITKAEKQITKMRELLTAQATNYEKKIADLSDSITKQKILSDVRLKTDEKKIDEIKTAYETKLNTAQKEKDQLLNALVIMEFKITKLAEALELEWNEEHTNTDGPKGAYIKKIFQDLINNSTYEVEKLSPKGSTLNLVDN
jgi:hypothetical protein